MSVEGCSGVTETGCSGVYQGDITDSRALKCLDAEELGFLGYSDLRKAVWGGGGVPKFVCLFPIYPSISVLNSTVWTESQEDKCKYRVAEFK